MKFIYLLFITFLLTGCGRPPLDGKGAIVKEIKYINNKKWCKYLVTSDDTKDLRLPRNSFFIDSCGKYTVGDTIKIVKK